MKNRNKRKFENEKMGSSVLFGEYESFFTLLPCGKKKTLKDKKSAAQSDLPVQVEDEGVYVADESLIPNIQGQKKCDFTVYCSTKKQTCFIELKGKNIPESTKNNPYRQIEAVIDFVQKEKDLEILVKSAMEVHAFIVSKGQQRVPNNDSNRMSLLRKIVSLVGKDRSFCHHVRVTSTRNYSNRDGRIECSSKYPLPLPFVSQRSF